jgi:hypothetical protein
VGENALAAGALLMAIGVCGALVTLRGPKRTRSAWMLAVCLPTFASLLMLCLVAREERQHAIYGVIIQERTLLELASGERQTLVEGMRVRIDGESGDILRVRLGAAAGTLPREAVRRLLVRD